MKIRHLILLGTAIGLSTTPAAAQFRYESVQWSPTGTELAVTATVDGNADIFVISLNGSGVRRLTRHPGRDAYAAWSPDGSRIAFSSDRGGDTDLYWMDSGGGAIHELVTSPGVDAYPSWSPDGRLIAFFSERTGRAQIWMADVESGASSRVTRNEGSDFNPSWSPRDSRILFESDRHSGDQGDLFTIRADGSEERVLTRSPENEIYARWAPDARRVTTCSIGSAGIKVRIIDLDGDVSTKIPGACLPAWSSDGLRLAFVDVMGTGALMIGGEVGQRARPVPGATEDDIRAAITNPGATATTEPALPQCLKSACNHNQD